MSSNLCHFSKLKGNHNQKKTCYKLLWLSQTIVLIYSFLLAWNNNLFVLLFKDFTYKERMQRAHEYQWSPGGVFMKPDPPKIYGCGNQVDRYSLLYFIYWKSTDTFKNFWEVYKCHFRTHSEINNNSFNYWDIINVRNKESILFSV